VGLLQNFNELVCDSSTGACAVIDPAFEVDRLLHEASQRGWRIEAVLLTHTHPDHTEGAEEMVRKTSARVHVGAGELEAAGRAAPSAATTALQGGEQIPIGNAMIETLATPGHTLAGISYLVPGAVFTGDTLFVGGCGRTDFPGGNPHVLWQSLMRLSALPDDTRVYPGHNYGETPTSTIGWERATNPYLRCRTEAEFVALRTGKSPPRPPKMQRK
jgi:hydroxyacylglutathione hydrolase